MGRILQYAVVYLPDGTLNPEAVGPFRSLDKAQLAAEAIDKAYENADPYSVQTPASVVTLLGLAQVLEEAR